MKTAYSLAEEIWDGYHWADRRYKIETTAATIRADRLSLLDAVESQHDVDRLRKAFNQELLVSPEDAKVIEDYARNADNPEIAHYEEGA